MDKLPTKIIIAFLMLFLSQISGFAQLSSNRTSFESLEEYNQFLIALNSIPENEQATQLAKDYGYENVEELKASIIKFISDIRSSSL